jgi:hypothetical protein
MLAKTTPKFTTMIKTQSPKPKIFFPSAPLPWAWNYVPPGGIPGRERCQTVGTPKEREQAVTLVAAYREQEEISRVNDIGGMSDELDKLGRMSRNAHGGIEGEMKRRAIRAADPDKYNAAQTRLAQLRHYAHSRNHLWYCCRSCTRGVRRHEKLPECSRLRYCRLPGFRVSITAKSPTRRTRRALVAVRICPNEARIDDRLRRQSQHSPILKA